MCGSLFIFARDAIPKSQLVSNLFFRKTGKVDLIHKYPPVLEDFIIKKLVGGQK